MCQGYFVSTMKAQNNTGPHCDNVDKITQTHLSTYLVLCSTEEFGTTSRRQNDDTLVSYRFKSAEVRFIVILQLPLTTLLQCKSVISSGWLQASRRCLAVPFRANKVGCERKMKCRCVLGFQPHTVISSERSAARAPHISLSGQPAASVRGRGSELLYTEYIFITTVAA